MRMKTNLNLREELLREHSKEQCNKIVQWVGHSQERFDKLFELFIQNEEIISQRAAWSLNYCVIAYPELLDKHWSAFLQNLQQTGRHNAIKRNSIRLLQEIEIPEEYHGIVMDTCFRLASTPGEAVAVKAFSLTVLGKLAKIYPDIIPELKLLIEDQLPNQTAAFMVRARQILKSFKINF